MGWNLGCDLTQKSSSASRKPLAHRDTEVPGDLTTGPAHWGPAPHFAQLTLENTPSDWVRRWGPISTTRAHPQPVQALAPQELWPKSECEPGVEEYTPAQPKAWGLENLRFPCSLPELHLIGRTYPPTSLPPHWRPPALGVLLRGRGAAMSSWLTGPHGPAAKARFPGRGTHSAKGGGEAALWASVMTIPMSLVDFSHPKVGGGTRGAEEVSVKEREHQGPEVSSGTTVLIWATESITLGATLDLTRPLFWTRAWSSRLSPVHWPLHCWGKGSHAQPGQQAGWGLSDSAQLVRTQVQDAPSFCTIRRHWAGWAFQPQNCLWNQLL